MIISNLFSIFDPTISLFSFSWLIILFVVFFLPSFFWAGGTFYFRFYSLYTSIKKEINFVIKAPIKGSYLYVGSIFFTICLYNFLALFPHIFSATSHLLITFPFSFSFWLSIVLFGWFNFIKHFLCHLIPVGTPLALISFIVLVEVLSNFIRPIALTFRLTANIMAGHLLMSLIGGALISLPLTHLLLGGLLQSLLVFIELGVSLIQAYVFSTLLTLYISERVPSH